MDDPAEEEEVMDRARWSPIAVSCRGGAGTGRRRKDLLSLGWTQTRHERLRALEDAILREGGRGDKGEPKQAMLIAW